MEMPLVRVTVPESGSREPVRRAKRVDLPSPLRPTTPMTSPVDSPRDTSERTVRVPQDFEMRSALTIFVPANGGSASSHGGASALHRIWHGALRKWHFGTHGVKGLETIDDLVHLTRAEGLGEFLNVLVEVF